MSGAAIRPHQKPTVRVTYQLQEIGTPNLDEVVGRFVKKFVK